MTDDDWDWWRPHRPVLNRALPCGICRTLHELSDLVPQVNHCWPCFTALCAAKGIREWEQPAGWWQICERCGQRNWVRQDRPLCPTCVRLPRRWRETLHICRICGMLFRKNRRSRRFCCGTKAREKRLSQARLLGTHTDAEWAECLFMHAYSCAYCGRADVMLGKDHVRPISRGGSDGISNIVPACGPCNSSKGARLLSEWKRHQKLGSKSGALLVPSTRVSA